MSNLIYGHVPTAIAVHQLLVILSKSAKTLNAMDRAEMLITEIEPGSFSGMFTFSFYSESLIDGEMPVIYEMGFK